MGRGAESEAKETELKTDLWFIFCLHSEWNLWIVLDETVTEI